MYRAEVDKKRNLLKISYTQRVGPEEAKRWTQELEPLLAELQSGFQVLVDLSGLEAMDLGCLPHIEAVMDLCNKKGVQTVVRVIPDPQKDIGLNILSLFHYRRHVHIVTCETMAEAKRALGQWGGG